MPVPTRRLILLAESDPGVRHALAKLLRLRGFDVLLVDSVDAALDAILTERPAAAIVELHLAGGSGRDVVVSMPPRVPVLIFSAAARESYELERLRPRTRLIPKPYSLVMLIEALEEMLASADALPKSNDEDRRTED